MKLKTENYKGVKINYEVDDKGRFICSALDIFREYENPSMGGWWNTIDEAEAAIHRKVDSFLSRTPKDYIGLAEAIQDTLVWEGYEDCHVDVFVLKTLVTNFIKFTNEQNH